jgi:hypothetical protein
MIATPTARAASRGIPEAVAAHSPMQPTSTKTSSSRTGHISLLYTPRFLHSGTPIPVGGSACRRKVLDLRRRAEVTRQEEKEAAVSQPPPCQEVEKKH